MSTKQRAYLCGGEDTDIEPGTRDERAIRGRIRTKVKNGVEDFSLLDGLKTEDLDLIYEDHPAWEDALGFLLRPHIREIVAAKNRGESAEGRARSAAQDTGETYERFLSFRVENALNDALKAEGLENEYRAEVDVRIREPESVADLEAQLQAGEIEPTDIQQRYRDRRIDAEALHQLTRGLELLRGPNDERRRELLNQSVPMLEDDAE